MLGFDSLGRPPISTDPLNGIRRQLMRISVLTQEILKSLLSYNRDTGIFTWISGNGKNVKPGKVCAFGSADEYAVINVLGRRHVVHRLACR